MSLRKALLTAAVLALPVAAVAQPISGLYISGGIGANWLAQTSVRSSTGGGGHISGSRAGIDGFASVGWGYGNGLRTELEILGINNDIKLHATGTYGSAQQLTYGLMANGLYDIPTGTPFTPYVGVGIGYVGVKEGSFTVTTNNPATSFAGDPAALGSFAAQGIVGVSFPVAPQLSATVDYRLLDKFQNRWYGGIVTQGATRFPGGVRIGNEVNQSINVGLTYAFGAPEAAPAPAPAPVAVAPAPAPARSYLVFFDWDKADLTARAQQIIAEAASNATKVGSTKISVAGHADRSGTPQYNMGLSLRRANNVAAELVRLGVPKTEIAITAYGDTKPLVPTAPGVREPQNRRVEIVLN
jgi:OmpA-OmpF porin, OOP family